MNCLMCEGLARLCSACILGRDPVMVVSGIRDDYFARASIYVERRRVYRKAYEHGYREGLAAAARAEGGMQ